MQADLPQVELEINGKRWQQVATLEHSRARDRHFTLVIDGETAVIQFGDGKHGARPPGRSRSIRVPYRMGQGYVHVVLQQGRARKDEDWNEEPDSGKLPGVYRGVVVDNLDPMQQLRLKVQVPQALGLAEVWAAACVPVGASSAPHIGKHVWIMFEQGNPQYPVWVGVIHDG